MLRYFIVEDDKLICEGLCGGVAWNEMDAQIVGTSDHGKYAIKQILSMDVDVVLTDVVLPGQSGIEMLEELQASGWNGQAIVMSAYQDINYLLGALHAQAVDFLFKPIKIDDLRRSVKQANQRILNKNFQSCYDRKSAEDDLHQAIHACDCDSLQYTLMTWWRINRHAEPTVIAKNEAISLLTLCKDTVCLSAAEDILESELHMLTCDVVPDFPTRYAQCVQRLCDELRNNIYEWRFGVRMTEVILEDLTTVKSEDLARKMNMSRASFYRQYNHSFSYSLGEYLQRLRVQAAYHNIMENGMDIEDAMLMCGYNDSVHFSYIMRKHLGDDVYLRLKNAGKKI